MLKFSSHLHNLMPKLFSRFTFKFGILYYVEIYYFSKKDV